MPDWAWFATWHIPAPRVQHAPHRIPPGDSTAGPGQRRARPDSAADCRWTPTPHASRRAESDTADCLLDGPAHGQIELGTGPPGRDRETPIMTGRQNAPERDAELRRGACRGPASGRPGLHPRRA